MPDEVDEVEYNKKVKQLCKLLPLYKNAILNYSNGKQDYDCRVYDYGFDDYEERDVDLSTHARDQNAGQNDASGDGIIAKSNPNPRFGAIPE